MPAGKENEVIVEGHFLQSDTDTEQNGIPKDSGASQKPERTADDDTKVGLPKKTEVESKKAEENTKNDEAKKTVSQAETGSESQSEKTEASMKKKYIKKKLCNYYREGKGKCDRGDYCGWAHSKEEIGKPALADPTTSKVTLCKYHRRGTTCMAGAMCAFAHGKDELGSPLPKAHPTKKSGKGEQGKKMSNAKDGTGKNRGQPLRRSPGPGPGPGPDQRKRMASLSPPRPRKTSSNFQSHDSDRRSRGRSDSRSRSPVLLMIIQTCFPLHCIKTRPYQQKFNSNVIKHNANGYFGMEWWGGVWGNLGDTKYK